MQSIGREFNFSNLLKFNEKRHRSPMGRSAAYRGRVDYLLTRYLAVFRLPPVWPPHRQTVLIA